MISLFTKFLSVKNHNQGVISNQNKKLNNHTPRKGKIIIRRKITHKSCNTNPKVKPIDN